MILAALLLSSSLAQPQTNVACTTSFNPQNVEFGAEALRQLDGTWHVIAVPIGSTTPNVNTCTQVVLTPVSQTSQRLYTGSYNNLQPKGANSQANGVLQPWNLDTGNPLFKLELDLGFVIANASFWILAAQGAAPGDVSALVTYSCDLPLGANNNAQLFFWSRLPYFVPPVTFDSLSTLARRAISNFDDFLPMQQVPQQQGWCDYRYASSYIPPTSVTFSPQQLEVDVTGAITSNSYNFTAEAIGIWVIAVALLGFGGFSLFKGQPVTRSGTNEALLG